MSKKDQKQEEIKVTKTTKETKETKEVRVFKGRPRPKTERRTGAKKLDLKQSAQLFNSEFFIYWPDPNADLSEYEDNDGLLDIDTVPEEHLIEFVCRYIDPGTFQEIVNTPLSYDLPKDRQADEKEIEEIIRNAIQDKLQNPKSEADIRYEVIQSCVIDPVFESVDQVKQILPLALQHEIYNEVTRGAIGDNLVARFQESSRK